MKDVLVYYALDHMGQSEDEFDNAYDYVAAIYNQGYEDALADKPQWRVDEVVTKIEPLPVGKYENLTYDCYNGWYINSAGKRCEAW